MHDRDEDYILEDDKSGASTSSVIRSPPATPGMANRASRTSYRGPTFIKEVLSGSALIVFHLFLRIAQDLDKLCTQTASVKLSAEIRGYLHNIVVFMRNNRAVHGGVSAMATKHLLRLSQYVHSSLRLLQPMIHQFSQWFTVY